jgi:hypothetical protein
VAKPERETTIGADLGYLKYAIFHGDSRIFSVTLAADPADRALRRVLREGPFEARPGASASPAGSSAVVAHHGRLCHGRAPQPAAPPYRGGAAARHARARGCGSAQPALWAAARSPSCTATALATCRCSGDLEALSGLRCRHGRELIPWYNVAVAQDRDALDWARRLREQGEPKAPDAGGAVDPRAALRDLLLRGLVPALRLDATVLRAFMRSFNLLDAPGDLMRQPDLMARVLAVYQRRHERAEPVLGPDRATLLGLIAAA